MFNRLKNGDRDEITFRVLLGFLLGFIPMRIYLFFEYAGIFSRPYIFVGDLHIHHFYKLFYHRLEGAREQAIVKMSE